MVLGKVLGVGDFSKRVRVCALGFSSSAKDKLKKAKSECIDIAEEIKRILNSRELRLYHERSCY